MGVINWSDDQIKRAYDRLDSQTRGGNGSKWFAIKCFFSILVGPFILYLPLKVAISVSSDYEIAAWCASAALAAWCTWSTLQEERRNKDFKEMRDEKIDRRI